MTKYSTDVNHTHGEPPAPPADRPVPPVQRGSSTCNLYAPGHQIHYKHQGDAMRSPSLQTREVLLDDTLVTLVLDDGSTLPWRHHDPARLGRILELVRGKRVAYPEYHALRVGPYWFNCAAAGDDWHDCRATTAAVPPRGR
jgi:hypothetical protein